MFSLGKEDDDIKDDLEVEASIDAPEYFIEGMEELEKMTDRLDDLVKKVTGEKIEDITIGQIISLATKDLSSDEKKNMYKSMELKEAINSLKTYIFKRAISENVDIIGDMDRDSSEYQYNEEEKKIELLK